MQLIVSGNKSLLNVLKERLTSREQRENNRKSSFATPKAPDHITDVLIITVEFVFQIIVEAYQVRASQDLLQYHI